MSSRKAGRKGGSVGAGGRDVSLSLRYTAKAAGGKKRMHLGGASPMGGGSRSAAVRATQLAAATRFDDDAPEASLDTEGWSARD